MKTLYLDLDGVLADFVLQCKLRLKMHPEEFPSRNKLMEEIKSCPGFFATMPVLPGAQALMEFCKTWARNPNNNYSVYILTAAPPTADNHCASDKKEWVRKNFGDVPVVVVNSGRDKYKQAKPGDILVDDMEENILPWKQAGGTGILHTSVRSSIQQLRNLND